jgi:hypothetical protein
MSDGSASGRAAQPPPIGTAFDPRDYGHTKLGELVRAESYVDVKDVPGPTGLSQLWVRLKPTARRTPRRR